MALLFLLREKHFKNPTVHLSERLTGRIMQQMPLYPTGDVVNDSEKLKEVANSMSVGLNMNAQHRKERVSRQKNFKVRI